MKQSIITIRDCYTILIHCVKKLIVLNRSSNLMSKVYIYVYSVHE